MCQILAGQDPCDFEPITRHLRLNGQSTSIRLKRSFWEILDGIAAEEGMTTPVFVSTLHSEVLEPRGETPNFTSLLRCACLSRMRQRQPLRAEAIAAKQAEKSLAWYSATTSPKTGPVT